MSGIAGIFHVRPFIDTKTVVKQMSKALQHRGNESLHEFSNSDSSGSALISVREHEENQAAIKSVQNHLLIVDSFPFYEEQDNENPFRKPEIFNALALSVDAIGLRLYRSLDGTRGLYYVHLDNGIAFASEKKCIWAIGKGEAKTLDPGYTLSFTWKGEQSLAHYIESEMPAINRTIDRFEAIGKLQSTLEMAFNHLSKAHKCAVLFSGGVDSAFAALLTRRRCRDTLLITAACRGSHDEEAAIKSAELIESETSLVEIDAAALWDALPEIVYSIESSNRMQVEIALPFFFAAREARRRGYRLMVSGQGADELFAGYARHETLAREEGEVAVERALWSEVSMTHETNIQRDARAMAANGLDVFFPYMYPPFVRTAMSLPAMFKVDPSAAPSRKIIFRQLAESCGLPHEISVRPKRATQYSSGISKLLFTSIIKKTEESARLNLNKREDSITVQRVLDTIALHLGIPSVTRIHEAIIDLEPTHRLQERLGLPTTGD